jgi:hypothetical protein
VNESGQAGVPVTVTAGGTVVTGVLIAEQAYFADLVERNPLMGALQPSSGLLGKEYAKDVAAESGHHLHIRATRGRDEGLWRISLESVDGWVLSAAPAGDDSKGPFERLLSN